MSIQEAVARAMWADTDDCPQRGWPNLNGVTKTIYQSNARVAIETFLDAAAKEGWQMVRRDEVTEEIITASQTRARLAKRNSRAYCYSTMLAAAPKFELDK